MDTINSLPKSVRDLEIDAAEVDIHYWTDQYAEKDTQVEPRQPSHLCKAIADRMPQLRHVRLRLGWFRSNVLAASPMLETLIFPFRQEHTPHHKRPCVHCQHPNSEQDGLAGAVARRTFIRQLKEHLPKWPRLQKLLVISNEQASFKPGLCTRDLLSEKTALNYVFYRFEDHVASLGKKHHFMRYRDADGVVKDLIGRTEVYDELLEGPSWEATTQGSRFPKAYKSLPAARKRDWAKYNGDSFIVMTHQEGLSAEAWKKAYDLDWEVRLWEREAEAGHLLVKPEIVQGADDVKPTFPRYVL